MLMGRCVRRHRRRQGDRLATRSYPGPEPATDGECRRRGRVGRRERWPCAGSRADGSAAIPPPLIAAGARLSPPAGTARRGGLRSTYFDTGDFRLRRRGFTLRIREEGDRLVQTLKSDGHSGAGAVAQAQRMVAPRGDAGSEPSRCIGCGDPRCGGAAAAGGADAGILHRCHAPHGPGGGPPRPIMARPWSNSLSTAERSGRGTGAIRSRSLSLSWSKGRPARSTISPSRCRPTRRSASRLRARPSAATSSLAAKAMPATRPRRSRWRKASRWTGPCARSSAPASTSARRTTMRFWTGPIPRASTSFASLCGGCARPSWSSRGFFCASTLPGWSGRRAVSSTRSARRAIGTCSLPRRLRQSVRHGRRTRHWNAWPLRPRRSAPAPTSRQRRCGRPTTRRSCFASAGGSRPPAGGTGPTGPCSTSRCRASGGLCSTSVTGACSSAGRNFEHLSDERLHQLRIALKKLRYAGEFFAAQYPDGRPRPYIRALRRLQDDLGRLNDAAVAERCLKELLDSQRESSHLAALGVGAGQVVGWHARAREEARSQTAEDWHAFAAATPYWRPAAGGSIE